jgi:hypothetical protein
MELSGSHGNRIELNVAGYQFPHLEHQEYDSDWLRIAINVNHPRGTWTSIDACLLTWEVARLADWFVAIATGDTVDHAQDFIEPNLRFQLLDDRSHMRVYFELECRPRWAPSDGAGMNDLWVDLNVDSQDLTEAASALRGDLERFPVRVHARANV